MNYWYTTPNDVTPEFGAWSNRIDWCNKHCTERWNYEGSGMFSFSSEPDYLLFLLTWA
jgi:hypothetical protein